MSLSGRRRWGVIAGFLLAASPVAAQVSLPLGPFPVGFSAETIGRRDRLQVTTWYPAVNGGTPLVYGDLLDLVALETGPPRREVEGKTSTTRAKYLAFMRALGLDSSAVAQIRSIELLARRGARPLPGSRPLLIMVQGNGQPVADQAILAEFLASHGFVVATSPSVTRRYGPPPRPDSIGPSAERQADDIGRVMTRVMARYPIDRRQIGLIGHSFGARGALLFMMRRRGVKVVVSLDGGIGTATGTASMRAAPSFSLQHSAVPILHFYETLSPPMKPDWGLLRILAGPVTVAKATGMRHHHFTDIGWLVGQVPSLAQATQADVRTAAAHRSVAVATLHFLRQYLGSGPASVEPAASGDSLLTLQPLAAVDR